MPVAEWILDMCTAACEVVNPTTGLPAKAITDPRHFLDVHATAGLDEVPFALAEAVSLMRLIVERRAQVAVTEVNILLVEDGLYRTHHHVWVVPGFLQRYLNLRWSATVVQISALRFGWPKVRSGPNTNSLRVPLRRCGLSRDRPFGDERLIDLWVGLEAFFKLKASRAALGRASRRGQGDFLVSIAKVSAS